MNKLPEIVGLNELCAAIVGEFAFMIISADYFDSNYEDLKSIDLNVLLKRTVRYFESCTDLDVIDTKKAELHIKIAGFLYPYRNIVDVAAIQQNVHHKLVKLL